MIRGSAVALTAVIMSGGCLAQEITVHVVDSASRKPVPGVTLSLRSDCFKPKRPKASQETADASGMARFNSISLTGAPLCLDLFSVKYASADLDYVFTSPEQATNLKTEFKMRNSILTSLPAEVTFHAVKRSLADRLHFMFMGD